MKLIELPGFDFGISLSENEFEIKSLYGDLIVNRTYLTSGNLFRLDDSLLICT